MFGFIVIDKPQGVTSRSALNKVSKAVRPSKTGHAGTLDPLATGVLVACIGPATRLTRFVQQMPKTYLGSFRLGFSSDTEDTDGAIQSVSNAPTITEKELTACLQKFVGEIMQTPPAFSAIKVDGKRAFSLARKGEQVQLKPRPIQVHSLKLVSFEFPDFKLEIECGSGTYVRSLGRDIARSLGTEAIMTQLQRSRIGVFGLTDAIELEGIDRERCCQWLIPANHAVDHLPQIVLDRISIDALKNGTKLSLPDQQNHFEIAAVDESNQLMAILKQKADGQFAPSLNFCPYWIGGQ